MEKGFVAITGVSSGIGHHAASFLIEKGYHVIGTVRKESDRSRLLEQYGDKMTCLLFDVRDFEAIERSMENVAYVLGNKKISGLINNAGIAIPGPMELVSDDEFEKQMQVNVLSVRKVTNSFLPYMYQNDADQKSKIIFISSVSGLFAAPFNGPYCISKHALECMVDIYRRELMIYDIDVVCIEPGPVQSKIWQKAKGRFDAFMDSVYGQMASKADRIISHSESMALPPERISQLIGKILESDRNKTRYLVHKNKLMFRIFSKWLPDRMVDKLIWKNLNKKDSNTYRPV